MKTVMSRVVRTGGISVAALGLLLGAAGVAVADEQSYLDYLFSHGWNYHYDVSSATSAIKGGHIVCDNIRWNGGPRNGVNPFMAASLDDLMIEAAQHELCPDTLESPK
ncbi:hypothetical protein ABW16_22635 [Mycolicibacter heraklionensis]|uniref:DUF732 domain-containing protein n=1 Tax=Mycolicibacter heraklionensis TaxID=512402 RepID=A0ABR5F9J2_9MYCO|nr:DUF732 domain-containing protein [Mycolicibacter heraklionensis]KLO25546.1 hypothetical protein ABW16_22635 [Mycolicibacter heraklionensis]